MPVTLVAVGNTAWYGGGMKVCPGADPTDGLFDVTVVGPISRRELIAHPAAARRRHARRAPRRSPCTAPPRVELSAPGVTTYADGEPVAPLPVTAECVPGALHVVGARRRR